MHGLQSRTAVELPAAWALRYLTEHQVLSAADLVTREVIAEDLSVSHRAFRVSIDDEPRYFVKRGDAVRSGGRGLPIEAFVYRLAARDASLATVLPRCWLVDDGQDVLVLDAIDSDHLLLEWPSQNGPPDRANVVAYGNAVARVHATQPAAFGEIPWLFVALEPRWGDYAWLPPACAALLARLAARPWLRSGFQQARRLWTTAGLIHGDLRGANVLVTTGAHPRIVLIDWELACVGDPAWDVGSVLADIVATRVLWHASDTDIAGVLATFDAFLDGYDAAGTLRSTPLDSLVVRSVTFAAVRLVQTLVEQAYSGDDTSRAEAALLPWVFAFLYHAPSIALMTATRPVTTTS